MSGLTPSLELQQLAFVEAIKATFGKRFFANKKVFPQHVRSECDLIVPVIGREKDMVAADFSRRHPLGKITWSHVSWSPRSYTEQADDNGLTYIKRKCISALTLFVSVLFLPAASFVRRAA